MTSELPAIPKLVFTVIEPLSLLGGFLAPILNAPWFITTQMSFTYNSVAGRTILNNIVAHDGTTQLLAQQLGNAYLLLGLLGVFILNTTSELKVVDAYLWALWLGDIGHVGLTVYAYGWQGLGAYANWSTNAWFNVLFVVFLFAVRSLYFAGFFGTSKTKLTVGERATKKKS